MKKVSIVSLLLLLFPFFSYAKEQQKINYRFVEEVYSYILQKKIQHPQIVLHQAILETGYFRGKYLMARNNLFGFRKVKYMTFKNWKASVDYYKIWQLKRYKNPNENYYDFLVRIKFATKQYKLHLLKIKYKPHSKAK